MAGKTVVAPMPLSTHEVDVTHSRMIYDKLFSADGVIGDIVIKATDVHKEDAAVLRLRITTILGEVQEFPVPIKKGTEVYDKSLMIERGTHAQLFVDVPKAEADERGNAQTITWVSKLVIGFSFIANPKAIRV